jgi:hypothetical protein
MQGMHLPHPFADRFFHSLLWPRFAQETEAAKSAFKSG